MAPDFNKIQSNHVNNVPKMGKKPQVRDAEISAQDTSCEVEEMVADTGVVGRSTVKADNFETDMKKFNENPIKAAAKMSFVDMLIDKGYSLEEAIYATHTEFDN